jgi:hypothetical protein
MQAWFVQNAKLQSGKILFFVLLGFFRKYVLFDVPDQLCAATVKGKDENH